VTRVGCLGEVMIELALEGDIARVGVAGDTYNAAVYLSRLLGGGVSYVTALGRDAMSERIAAAMRAEGLSDALVERRDGMSPGLYAISTDGAGERSFTYWRSASAARTLFREPCAVGPDRLLGLDLVLLSAISVAILPQPAREALRGALARLRTRGGRVAFDSNHRPALWEDAATARREVAAMWALTDVGLPSLDDEMALFGDPDEAAVLARLRGAGVSVGALKRGAAGPVGLMGEGTGRSWAPAPRVVDTTAAGDSFGAGFLAGLLRGAGVEDAMEVGHALAREVVGHRGAILPPGRPAPLG
jgi:2-dehydro-3-deoxygluconokinase